MYPMAAVRLAGVLRDHVLLELRDPLTHDSAIGQMAHVVERKLDSPRSFGLTAICTVNDEGFVYGSMRSGAAGRSAQSMSKCWLDAQGHYDESSLSAALHHAVDYLRHCCK